MDHMFKWAPFDKLSSKFSLIIFPSSLFCEDEYFLIFLFVQLQFTRRTPLKACSKTKISLYTHLSIGDDATISNLVKI